MNNNEVVIAFVIFRPSRIAIQRILEISKNNIIIVVNNSPDLISLDSKSITHYYEFDNIGLSKALNFIAKKSIELGYDWLLYLDQDTFFNADTIRYFKNSISNFISSVNKILILSFTNKKNKISKFKKVKFVFSSGSMFNLRNLSNIGFFNIKYFVDCIDYDICLRASINKYLIYKIYNTPFLDHRIEQEAISSLTFFFKSYSKNRVQEIYKGIFTLTKKSLLHFEFRYSLNLLLFFFSFSFSQLFFKIYNAIK